MQTCLLAFIICSLSQSILDHQPCRTSGSDENTVYLNLNTTELDDCTVSLYDFGGQVRPMKPLYQNPGVVENV